MTRKEFVLAALAPAKGATHSPVQVQKLFFLIDRNIPGLVGGPQFAFEAYNYGPFDSDVYAVLEELAAEDHVEINCDKSWREYRLTVSGQTLGEVTLNSLDAEAKAYITQASEFVRRLTFTQLVASIYKAYPEMRANSVFQE